MRILVLGSCQAPEIARHMAALLPDASVTGHEWPALSREGRTGEVADSLGSYDVVFANPNHARDDLLLADDVLRARARHVEFFPLVAYTGFHPDLVYLDGGLHSPLHDYHSGIVAAAFVAGIERSEVAGLFNALVYGELGYFREPALSERFLVEDAARLGYDLTALLPEWTQSGTFMLTVNHPTTRVLHDLARLALTKWGRVPFGRRPAAMPESRLAQLATWPVYPEIAQRFGVTSDFIFRSALRPDGGRRELTLSAFVDACYEIYAEADRQHIATPRILQIAGALQRLRSIRYLSPPELLVSQLYRAILDRDPDPGGLAYYSAQITRTGDPAIEGIARGLSKSDEARQNLLRSTASLG